MDRYQLAKLVQWSGTLKTRKRLQKVVCLLRHAGADIQADFGLHLYGPYSSDVAQRTDEMVAAGLLIEQPGSNPLGGKSFEYALPEKVQTQLADLDTRPANAAFAKHETLAKSLLNEDLRKLELASTVAHIYATKKNWDEARTAAANFKKCQPDSDEMRAAERLARRVVEGSAN